MSVAAPTPEDFRSLLVSVGIDPEKSIFSPADLKILIVTAILKLQDEQYGHSTIPLPIGSADLLIRLMNSGSNLEDAIDILQNFSKRLCPQNWVSTAKIDDDYIFCVNISGIDAEHGGAIELTGVLVFLFAMQAFVGEKIQIKKLYSRSKLYTSLVDYNYDSNCSVEYANFTGIKIDREVLKRPRRASFESSPLSNAIRWGLFVDKGITGVKTDGRLRLEAEQILQTIENKARKRNLADRQKRRLARKEGEYSVRELKRSIKAADAIVAISTTDKSMTELSADLGFSDERALRRFFRGAVGCTPLEYRQLAREENASDGKDVFGVIMDGVRQLS